ncbi:MAG TPA: proteasome subunit beta [Actinomycetota bacterium]|nr:proteasome subunit beta [Actinomycetota bacterium]
MSDWGTDWTRAAFAPNSNPSFADLLKAAEPHALPPTHDPSTKEPLVVPHATTILALTFADGVVMAGDRRATEGYQIADRYIVKVFPADNFSAVAIAGAAGPALDMVRLFQTELEHYEKVEGETLSLEGKANKLAQMIKANFPMAMQGLIVVPLFAGFDRRRTAGRIFRYDAVGGRYEDSNYHATGSGGKDARSALRTSWFRGLSQDAAIHAAVEALTVASDEDVATGGPDLARGIFPVVATVTGDGYREVTDDELRPIVADVITKVSSTGQESPA